jgi:hypothetical protein
MICDVMHSVGDTGDQATAGEIQQKILNILGEDYKNDEWSDDAVYDSLPAATKHGEVVDKVEEEQDMMEESKNKIKQEKMARLEHLRQKESRASTPPPLESSSSPADVPGRGDHSAPAGEVGGYYPGHSTLPPPRSPITAFLRVAKPEEAAVSEDKESGIGKKEAKSEDDVLKKIYDSMMKKHTE